MIVFPAVDIKNGYAVRLRQGKKDNVDVFSRDPVGMALHWQDQGVKGLHVIDLDGAFDGSTANIDLITRIASRISIPLQIGGGIRSLEIARKYLDAGATRLIIGTMALEEPDIFNRMLEEFPGRIGVSLDAENGKLKTRGWVKDSGYRIQDVLPAITGAAFLVYTDIERDGMHAGINLEALEELLSVAAMPVMAAGGVSGMADIEAVWRLRNAGNLEGIITGRAIYEGTLDPGKAQAWLDEH